jgi:lauroyl/myristoyl acyltransferase
LPVAPAIMSLRTGAPIIPGYTYRADNDTYVIEFLPPLIPPPNKTDREAVTKIMDEVAAVLEKIVESHLGQWLALQPVWPDHNYIWAKK